jgi:hypothetical protein
MKMKEWAEPHAIQQTYTTTFSIPCATALNEGLRKDCKRFIVEIHMRWSIGKIPYNRTSISTHN